MIGSADFSEMMLDAVVVAARTEANLATDPKQSVNIRLQAIEYCLFTVQGPVLGPRPGDRRYQEAAAISRKALANVDSFLTDVAKNSRARFTKAWAETIKDAILKLSPPIED